MTSAHVLSIQALGELKATLNRFSAEAQEAFNAAEIEIRRTLDWLQERLTYWRNEVRRRQEVLAQAQRALDLCRASGYRDPQTGAYVEPPCTAQREAMRRAWTYLNEAETELRKVQEWARLVQQAADDYRRQAQRLHAWLNGELPKATAFLERKMATLQSYVALGAPSGGYVVTPPAQAVGETFAAAVGVAALGVGLAAAAIAVTRWLAGDVRHALGHVGESLSAQLLRQQLELQEVPFDPPKHGFDRVFTAPGLPVIVMESKVVGAPGRPAFRPAQTQHGEQGSPEWIAAQAENMADPSSAQWSPANERIAALVQEMGPGKVPSVAVVIQRDTGLADVYVRPASSEAWQPLREGVSLAEALAATAGEAHAIQDIPLAQIDWKDVGHLEAEDYHKVSYEEMRAGLLKLEQVVRLAVRRGATAEDFTRMDEEQGLDYAHGYRRIYDAFYGTQESIAVEKVGGTYQVLNGRHRLLLARELGLDSLPARVVAVASDPEDKPDSGGGA
jgi:hypothetical protein